MQLKIYQEDETVDLMGNLVDAILIFRKIRCH